MRFFFFFTYKLISKEDVLYYIICSQKITVISITISYSAASLLCCDVEFVQYFSNLI